MDDGNAGNPAEGTAAEELNRVREVVLKAHPDAVPELIAGTSIAELLASVEPARTAFARLSERIKPAAAPPATPPAVPAGAATAAIDPASLPSHELIRRGIGERHRRPSTS